MQSLTERAAQFRYENFWRKSHILLKLTRPGTNQLWHTSAMCITHAAALIKCSPKRCTCCLVKSVLTFFKNCKPYSLILLAGCFRLVEGICLRISCSQPISTCSGYTSNQKDGNKNN